MYGNKRIVVGMSGGVDSSMTLVLLKKQGWNPIAVSLKMASWNEDENIASTNESFKIAKEVCDKLNVEHHIYDVSKEFQKEVIDYFINELKNRRTPNPCVVCNRNLKFKYLFKWANEHGIDYVSTGHYAKIEEENGIYLLKLSKDPTKDQTYGLSMFPQEWLSKLILPLGEHTKKEVYLLAEKEGFTNYKKIKQSQDLCFVSKKDLPKMIEQKLGIKEGDIVDVKGKLLGKHKGLHFYTIGQTRKLNLPGKFFVKKFDVKENKLIVTDKVEETHTVDEIILSPYNFTIKEIEEPKKVNAKIRYGDFVNGSATLYPPKDGKLIIKFDKPMHAVTPGQFCVFYEGEICLGGGVIN
jgi:tRNA-uridine 2-sulfurtransferase